MRETITALVLVGVALVLAGVALTRFHAASSGH
jgi:drug/metabolite transporter (DMT)-like permease